MEVKETLESRKLSDVIFSFAGLTLSVTAFLVGSTVGMNLPLWKGILAIVAGNTVLAAYSGLIGAIGQKTRKSSTEISKPAFGSYGQILTSSIVTLFLMGFVAVYASMIGQLLHTLFPMVPAFAGSFVFILCVLFTAYFGITGMSKLSKIALPLLFIFVVVGLVSVGKNFGFAKVLSTFPEQKLALGLIVSQVISVWASAATFSADMNRFVSKTRQVYLVTFVSFGLTALLEVVGYVCALATGRGDLVQILSDLNLVAISLFIYLILMWTSAQSLLYSFSLAFTNIIKLIGKGRSKVRDKTLVVVGAGIAFVISLLMIHFGLTASFNKFLLAIGIAIPPIGGILISHYYLVFRGERVQKAEKTEPVNLTAYLAWFMSILVAKFANIGIPALNGLLSAMILYWFFCFILAKKA